MSGDQGHEEGAKAGKVFNAAWLIIILVVVVLVILFIIGYITHFFGMMGS